MKVHVRFGRELFVLVYLQRCLAVPQTEDKFRMVLPFFISIMKHIGKQIEEELRRPERSVTWFAKQLCCERTNVYSIFKRESIDTFQLYRISLILEKNFFTLPFEEIEESIRQKYSTKL